MTTVTSDVAKDFQNGILLCRKGKWREGYELLARIAPKSERRGNLPGIFYSYMGAAMARVEGRRRDGMELCRYALQLAPEEAENYLNIASVYLMLGRRKPAVRAVQQGLALAPSHVRLAELRDSLGVRQDPVFRGLSRTHPLNTVSGRVRHWIRSRKRSVQERREEVAKFGE
jgi:tetratricopeptide (TPR) repeat protein